MKCCYVDKCPKPVFGAVPMPTKNYNGVKLWYFCKDHYKVYSAVNNMLTKFCGETDVRKRAFSGKLENAK